MGCWRTLVVKVSRVISPCRKFTDGVLSLGTQNPPPTRGLSPMRLSSWGTKPKPFPCEFGSTRLPQKVIWFQSIFLSEYAS